MLGGLLLLALLLRIVRLGAPDNRLIFDEAFYVNAARVILSEPVIPPAPYAFQPAGHDPNREHPPFGKLLLAASISVVGDHPLGWRLPSLIAGIGSILLLYSIVRTAGGDPWLGVFAAGLLAFDNLAFVHSRIGTLDMLLVALLLLSAWFYLGKWPLAAGIACAFAALVKLVGVYGLLALLVFEAGHGVWQRRQTGKWPRTGLRSAGLLIAGFVPVWVGGLWLLDLWLTDFGTPWQHLRFMVAYGSALASPAGPTNYESYPWQWLANEAQVPYLRMTEQVRVGDQVIGTRAVIDFRGAMNPAIIGVALPALAYAAWRAWRLRDPLALWVVAWVAGHYLPFYPLVLLTHRITYLYYFLPALPAVTVAIAQTFHQSGLPRPVLWGYLAAVLIGFVAYFPFRTIV